MLNHIKYLWDRYITNKPRIPRRPLTRPQILAAFQNFHEEKMAASRQDDSRAVLIALADKLEARGQCQTLSIDAITYAEIKKIELNGGITIPVLGPARIIIIKEEQQNV